MGICALTLRHEHTKQCIARQSLQPHPPTSLCCLYTFDNDVNMAQDSDVPTSADKGKGKAVEEPKNDKSVANGKKEDEEKKDATGEELNEEDQQLKNELDMIVERLTESNTS